MFKNSFSIVGKGIFIVHKGVTKGCSFPTFIGVQFSNNVTNRIVTDYLVLPVDIRYNDLPFLSNY
jgi:hypothetical protein